MAIKIELLLFASILVFLVHPLQGQYQVSSIGPDDLPEVESLHYLSQTPDNFYWATSENGIIRFDGSKGNLFPIKDPLRTVQLRRYFQSPLIHTHDGKLWLSTYAALHKFDPNTETFKSIQLSDEGEVIDKDYYLISIDSVRGVAMLRAGNYLWDYELESGNARKTAYSTSGVRFASIGQNAWAAVGYNNILEVYRRESPGLTFEREEFVLPDILMSAAVGNDGTLWLGTNNGLARMELNQNGYTYDYEVIGEGDPVRALISDEKGDIWYTSRTTGVCRLASNNSPKIDTFGIKEGLSGTDPRWITQDNSGRVWVSHYDLGFNIISETPKGFNHILTGRPNNIADLQSVGGMGVLVGTQNGQIELISETGTSTPSVKSLTTKNSQSEYSSKLKFGASGKQVWAGNQKQLGRFDLKKGEFIWYDRPINPKSDFYRSADGLLVVLSNQGVMSVRPSGDSIDLQPLLPFPPADGKRYTGLFSLTDSTFLIWERGSEIWPCLVRNRTVQITSRVSVDAYINTALQWRSQSFLGTNAGLFEVKKDTIVAILKKDSQGRTPRIMSIAEDRLTDNLYLGTTNGLIRYNPTTNKQTHFGRAEGLPDEEFLPADPVQLDNGTIWMATKSGIIRFHPDSLVIPEQKLTPYVSNLWVNDIEQPEEMIGQNLRRVERGYQQNSIYFRLGMVGLLPAGEGMVEYQLTDYDLTPVRVARNEVVRYPQLPPGEYELQLTAIDGRGERSGTATVAVVINPPFWATVWFRVAVVLALALGAMLVYTMLLRRERRKQALIREREAMISAERDRIAGEVHDDLGGQLSSIMFLSEELLLTEAAPALGYELGRINELSQHSLHNIRDIIFALDNRRASVGDLCEQIQTAGQEFFRDHKLAFSFNGHCTSVQRPLNSRQKRNLFSIVREAWHNTVKHAEAGHVTMSFGDDDHHLTITITDDGRGLPATAKPTTGGYGLGNMKTKAEAIGGTLTVTSRPGQGTTINLHVPL